MLVLGGGASAELQLDRKDPGCLSSLRLHWNFRIVWDEQKRMPPPGLILRHYVTSYDFLVACSSAECLMSISEDEESKGNSQETI